MCVQRYWTPYFHTYIAIFISDEIKSKQMWEILIVFFGLCSFLLSCFLFFFSNLHERIPTVNFKLDGLIQRTCSVSVTHHRRVWQAVLLSVCPSFLCVRVCLEHQTKQITIWLSRRKQYREGGQKNAITTYLPILGFNGFNAHQRSIGNIAPETHLKVKSRRTRN